MTYCFRYRVLMCTPLQVEANECVNLAVPGLSAMKVTASGTSIGIGKWVIFKACGFDTEDAAQRAGGKFGDALLITGAVGKLGIDMGFSRSTLQFGSQIHEAVRQKLGREVRPEMHGLMTFEENTLAIVGMDMHASVITSKEAFEQRLAPWASREKPLTDRQRNCAALLNDSFFIANTETQFILRVSAIEALCEQCDVGAECQDVVRSLKDHLAQLRIKESTRVTVERWLDNACRESVRQSYMAKFRALLSESEAKAFDKLYVRRSKLLHDGVGRGELSQASDDTLQLAVAVLEAELLS